MRSLKKLLTLSAPVALVALMGFPAAASASGTSNNAWIDSGEFVGYVSGIWDDPATLQVSGNLDLAGLHVSVNCDVTGEIKVWNDWNEWQGDEPDWTYNYSSTSQDSPARNSITSLEAESCTGQGQPNSCPPSAVTFDGLPWSGVTRDFESEFTNVSSDWDWSCSGVPIDGVDGSIRLVPQGSGCIEGFEVVQDYIGNEGVVANGTLEVDGFAGLVEGDCLLLW